MTVILGGCDQAYPDSEIITSNPGSIVLQVGMSNHQETYHVLQYAFVLSRSCQKFQPNCEIIDMCLK